MVEICAGAGVYKVCLKVNGVWYQAKMIVLLVSPSLQNGSW